MADINKSAMENPIRNDAKFTTLYPVCIALFNSLFNSLYVLYMLF